MTRREVPSPIARDPRKTGAISPGPNWWEDPKVVTRGTNKIEVLIQYQETRPVPCFLCVHPMVAGTGTYLYIRPTMDGEKREYKAGRICDSCRDNIIRARGEKPGSFRGRGRPKGR